MRNKKFFRNNVFHIIDLDTSLDMVSNRIKIVLIILILIVMTYVTKNNNSNNNQNVVSVMIHTKLHLLNVSDAEKNKNIYNQRLIGTHLHPRFYILLHQYQIVIILKNTHQFRHQFAY